MEFTEQVKYLYVYYDDNNIVSYKLIKVKVINELELELNITLNNKIYDEVKDIYLISKTLKYGRAIFTNFNTNISIILLSKYLAKVYGLKRTDAIGIAIFLLNKQTNINLNMLIDVDACKKFVTNVFSIQSLVLIVEISKIIYDVYNAGSVTGDTFFEMFKIIAEIKIFIISQKDNEILQNKILVLENKINKIMDTISFSDNFRRCITNKCNVLEQVINNSLRTLK